MFKVLWAFGVLFVSQANGFQFGDFGVCQHVVATTETDNSVSPPRHFKKNITIVECCVGFLTMKEKCVPECERTCVNSYCIGNNKCRCNSGYNAVDDFRCLPSCEPPCGDNMACLAPNRCFCKNDYKRVNESYCDPICSFQLGEGQDFDCINARCVAPNVCECLTDHNRVSEFQCDPICTNCENGDCVGPEICECKEEFEKNSYGVCAPVCSPTCINAKCIAPNKCKCYENFEKSLKSNECLEKQIIKDRQSCEIACQHGTCTDDGTCVCDSEYEKFNGKCLKKCYGICTNGKCLEDQCICGEGYKLSENLTECLPICAFEELHDCISGICIAPQICECFEGFKFLDDRNCTCVPRCSPQCVNGVCTEAGCICHEDFYNISSHECIKNCSEGFQWVYDECIDVIDLGSGENSYDIFDEAITTESKYYEDTSETTFSTHEETSVNDDDSESDDDDEGSTSVFYSITEREVIMVEKSLQQMIPTTMCIILLSIIIILIISILTTLFFLYHRMDPKNIYHVNEQEKSHNCVYFTKANGPADIECTL